MNLIITLHFSSTQFDLEKILLISLIYKDVVLLERQEEVTTLNIPNTY